MRESGSVISFSSLSVGFESRGSKRIVLDKINGSVLEGELISLIGANGSGKSTLIKTLIAIQPKFGGAIEVFGKNLNSVPRRELAQKIGYVASGVPLPNSMTILELVTLGRFPHTNWIGRLRKRDKTIITESIDSVGLSSIMERGLFQISDGERQRAMIARALAQDPSLLVLDEPMAFLDLPNKYELIDLLKRLAFERNKSILISTHDLNIAVAESDKIWLLHNSSLFEGGPEDLLMNGEFALLFGESKLSFIEEDGAFKYPSVIKRRVRLISDKELRSITTRALIRLRIGISESESDPLIRVESIDNKTKWTYFNNNNVDEFYSLYDLCYHLKLTNK